MSIISPYCKFNNFANIRKNMWLHNRLRKRRDVAATVSYKRIQRAVNFFCIAKYFNIYLYT